MTLKKTSVNLVIASGLLVAGATAANAGNCHNDMATWCYNHTTMSVPECNAWAEKFCSIATSGNNGGGAKQPGRTITPFKAPSQTFGTNTPTTRQLRIPRG